MKLAYQTWRTTWHIDFGSIRSNACNQLKKESHEETIILKRPTSSSSNPSPFNVSVVLSSPRSVDDTMMDKSSRSSLVSSDIDDLETSSTKSNEAASAAANKPKQTKSNNSNAADQRESDQPSALRNKEPEVKENEISHLVNDMKRLESTINSLRESTASQISQLEEMLNLKNKIIIDLEERLDQQRDYEEIKRELSLVRNELSHFTPVTPSLDQTRNPKAIESFLADKSKDVQPEQIKVENTNNPSAQQMIQRHPFFNSFALPQLQSLGNVESFGTLLGEEIANTYAKALVKRDPSFLAMAAAAAASQNPNLANNKLNSSSNNLTVSLSPSHTLNGDEVMEEKSTSASTTPTSAMICSEGADPLNHSPLGATTVSDLGLNVNSYSPLAHNSPSYDKLQHQLRCNVEKYMNETLNTLQISRCVRELLSMHNIGQRLFAKYVLGLSQGTVSELLSKPKPWDKLTEKGRDSYRKMHAWATDERCINLLKSMVPRKGKDSTSYKQEDPVAEERINQILNEAQRSMKTLTRSDMFATNLFNGENLQGKIDKELKNNCINDNTSDNFSDHDEKPEVPGNDCRSPSLNATAMATINNFYRNFNDSPNFNDSRNRNRLKFCENEENVMQSPDLMRLYQDQLTKLIGQHIEEGFRSSQNYGDVRNAITLYQQEMSRINPFAAQVSNPELFARLFSAGYGGLPLCLDSIQQSNQTPMNNLRKASTQLDSPQPRDNREPLSCDVTSESRSKIESMLNQFKPEAASPSHNGALSGINSNNNNNNSNNNINSNNNNSVSSVLNNSDLSAAEDLAASPLQRMQSITNSLLSQSSLPSLPSQPSRPTKAVLPPITQQQFDQYNNLNTEDIVKRVKEQLSQYSISQRLFGESVLGLSQGSVSDLLARPKPWHMLTQKGREPFIRMKMFLEDENAIHKLVASQYKIAPEKLMRTGSFVAGSAGIPNISVAATVTPQASTPPSSISISSNTSSNKNTHIIKPSTDFVSKYEQSMSPNSTENGCRSNASTPELNLPNPVSNSAPSPMSMRQRIGVGYGNINNNLLRPTISQSSGAYMQPSVYELAALTSDLDTQIITTRIKETLMAHNIGQKIFGEVVLGLSQGSVSELLSKPKPWNMLSIKGREPFIRMQLWLNDTNNIDKLQTLKNERREANKRRRTHMDEGFGFKPLDNKLFNFSNNFNMANSIGKGLLSTSGSFPMSSMSAQPVVKKARILFTEEQKEALRIAFAMDPYPSSTTAEFLAKELNLSIRTITNWFHNHRMRLKQINTTTNSNGDESNQATLPYNIGRDNVSFDQSQFRTLLSQRLSELKLRSGNVVNSNNSSNGSSNNGNSNQYFTQNASGSPQHRFKYSSSMFQAQSLYSNNTNSCSSPESSSPFHEEEEMGTLDLSVSSHNQHRHLGLGKLDSTGRSSVQDDSDDGCRSEDDTEEIEIAPNQDQPKQSSLNLSNKKFIGSSRRKPQHVMSSSSRRKAAQPQQWVAPLDLAGISEDDYVEDDYEDDCDNVSKPNDIARYGQHNKQTFSDKDKTSEQTDDEDNADIDDQKTDEDDDQTGIESDADENEATPPPYKKLKSASACVMSKMAMSEDSSNVMQECVQ